jgi:UDP-N-acetylmuramoylalanine--D-glutamate ligase
MPALAGRRVTVMGLGLQGGGVEVVRFLATRGAEITVTDARPAEKLAESLHAIRDCRARTVLGEHRAEDFTGAEIVVANPAVAPSHPLLASARAAGAWVTSEMALFLEACPARVVLITGTQGKSSTTHATATLLEHSGFRVFLGGNIGRSLLGELEHMRRDDVAVVEISSYQLESLPADFGPCARVAAVCVTNVLADHLERHGSIEAYEAAKRRVLELAGDEATLVLSGEDPRVGAWRPAHGHVLRVLATRASERDLNLAEGWFRLGSERLGRVADLRLPGAFQRENMLAALGLARSLGASPESLAAAVGQVAGLEHRLQDLGLFAGHRVWDNAVSTTPDSTLSALRALGKPVALLVGGQAKSLPLEELADASRSLTTRVIAFGASAEFLASAFRAARVDTRMARTVEEAVELAFGAMRPGEELLFSPACASFDAYRNFKDRALAFRAALPRRR